MFETGPGLTEARQAMAAAVAALRERPDLSATQVRASVALLAEMRAVVEGLLGQYVGLFDAAALAPAEGLPTTRSWLRARLRMADDDAARVVGLARAAERVPAAAAAMCAGELHAAHLRVIDRSLRDVRDPEPRRASEQLLLREAVHRDARELDLAVGQRLREVFRPEATVTEPEQLTETRALRAARTMWGTVDVHGTLDPANGEAFLAAFEPLARPLPDDSRTPAQRGADALGEMSRRLLSEGGLGEVGGERPHLVLTVDTTRLAERLPAATAGPPVDAVSDRGGTGLVDGGVLPSPLHPRPTDADDLQRLLRATPPRPEYSHGGDVDWRALLASCCDATITRLVLGPDSVPLDVGWKARTWSPAQRRAIAHRDKHCTWCGCRRPPAYCEVDHIIPVSAGGRTDVANGRLLCSFHHQLRHDGWTLTGAHGDWVATPPDDWADRLARRRRRRREAA